MKTGYIYKIANPEGAIYIGQTTNIHARERDYKGLYSKVKRQKLLYKSIKRYGWDNHKFEIVYKFDLASMSIDTVEMFFVEFFKSYYYVNSQYGLNLTLGGGAPKGYKHSIEYRKRISERMIGKPNLSWVGKKMSDEHKQKISRANKGKRKGCIGKKPTEEQCRNMGLRNKGNQYSCKSVVQLSKTGEFIREWSSQTVAAKEVGIGSSSQITNCCKKVPKYNTAGGYKWVYSKEYHKN